MNDCSNAEIRDRLPDLMHDTLAANERAVVLAHVETCAECREELALLRSLHGMLAVNARVNVARIVTALPKPPTHAARQPETSRPRRSWLDWRIAAAVTLLVAGGSSVALYHRLGPTTRVPFANAVTPVVPGPLASSRAPTPAETVASASEGVSSAEQGLGMSGRLGDLDDRQLQSLIDDIDRLEAVPITEPDPVVIRIDTTNAVTTSDRGRGTE
jgi:anti-sigma factor RsiW